LTGCQKLLDTLGHHKSEQACHGEEAIELAKKKDFDLILMDCSMPVCDGYEATRRILELVSLAKRPPPVIVAISADATVGKAFTAID
jgi:CheY-like chemotaxis protein